MRTILDTNVLIGGVFRPRTGLEVAVTSLSYAELRYGLGNPRLSPEDRVVRAARLARLESEFGPGLPFDDAAAISYGLVTELVQASGRSVRGRVIDLMIAAVAHAAGAALMTDNGDDYKGLERLVAIISPT